MLKLNIELDFLLRADMSQYHVRIMTQSNITQLNFEVRAMG